MSYALMAWGDLNPDEVRADFDDYLRSDLTVIDPEKADLMRALGQGPWRR